MTGEYCSVDTRVAEEAVNLSVEGGKRGGKGCGRGRGRGLMHHWGRRIG